MKSYILLGIGRLMLPLPRFILDRKLSQTKPVQLSDDHHRVRDFVVREIPNVDRPLTPAHIAESVNMDQAKTVQILDDLEKGMTFLWRGDRENVTWAYPVTVDETPHRYRFDTGEVGHAA